MLVTDSAGSSVLAVNRYDEYGIPQSTNAGRFQYTGQAWIAELGMYYYKARIYSPTLGRFLQTDPIGYDGGVNLYTYVDGDPVNGIDPDGLAPLWLGDGGGLDGIEGSRMGGTRIENPIERKFRRVVSQVQRQAQPPARAPVSRGTRSGRAARIGPGGLRAQEGGMHNGHTLSKHVGLTPKQLRNRLRNEPARTKVSTFTNEHLANASLNEALNQSRATLNGWLIFQGGVGTQYISYRSPVPIGTVLERGASRPRDAYTATFAVRANPDPSSNFGLFVVTGWVD